MQQRTGTQAHTGTHACSSRAQGVSYSFRSGSDHCMLQQYINRSQGRCIRTNGQLLQPACTFPSQLTPLHLKVHGQFGFIPSWAHDTRFPHTSSPSHAVTKPWLGLLLPHLSPNPRCTLPAHQLPGNAGRFWLTSNAVCPAVECPTRRASKAVREPGSNPQLPAAFLPTLNQAVGWPLHSAACRPRGRGHDKGRTASRSDRARMRY